MSRLDILPDDIIDHIFWLEHSSKFEMSLSAIKMPYRRKVAYDSHIWSVFFSTNMTKQDMREWYLFDRWLDLDHPRKLEGLTPDFLQEMERSKYISLYKDFLRRLREM